MNATRETTIVTGGCGFVGARLCAALVRAGKRVVALDDLSVGSHDNLPADIRDAVELVTHDVRDRESIETLIAERQPDTVYHLAAMHFIPACNADPAAAISINVTGTQVLLSACHAFAPSATLVLASTGAVYAPSRKPHAEDDALRPTDIYGLTKLWMEQLAELHQTQFGTRIAIARLFNVVGPGETNPHLLPEILQQAAESDTLSLGNLTTRRDYIAVDDIAAGLMLMADAIGGTGMLVCNLGREDAIDGNALLRIVGEVLDRKLKVDTDSTRLRASDRPVLESDCARAHRVLGWRARESLHSTIRAAAEQPLRPLATVG